MKLSYWIQRADYSAQDFEPVDLVQAELILRDHDWRSELRYLKPLESDETDFCPPSVGFKCDQLVLQFCPHLDRTADCHLNQPASSYARSRAERVGEMLLVIDPDAIRSIENAPLLLQYRLLQLHFRPDDDALLYLFDEYLAPARK